MSALPYGCLEEAALIFTLGDGKNELRSDFC